MEDNMKRDKTPQKAWGIAGGCGILYLFVGILMLVTPQKDVAWTMVIGGTILLCVGIAIQQLSEILRRLDALEGTERNEPEQQDK